MLLEARGGTEVDSAPKPTTEKPLSTPEMDALEAEEMANSMMWNSPLPEAERSDEKLPEEGSEKLPEGIPTGKLIMPFAEGICPFFPLI